jgi:hypothetical protein
MWSGVLEHPLVWTFSIFLGGVWLSRLLAAALHMHKIAEITDPEYEVPPVDSSGRVGESASLFPRVMRPSTSKRDCARCWSSSIPTTK